MFILKGKQPVCLAGIVSFGGLPVSDPLNGASEPYLIAAVGFSWLSAIPLLWKRIVLG